MFLKRRKIANLVLFERGSKDANCTKPRPVDHGVERAGAAVSRRTVQTMVRKVFPWLLVLKLLQTLIWMLIKPSATTDQHSIVTTSLKVGPPVGQLPLLRKPGVRAPLITAAEIAATNALLDSFKASNKSVLVIGGSDGSGTRSFVDVMARIGVPMILDDGETLDIHGQPLFAGKGWPPLIQAVLGATHSADYEWEELPSSVQATITTEIGKFNKVYLKRADDLLKKVQHVPLARNISFGFKAPISMLLLPVLRHVYGSIKFLHIVRDGRDVSFSDNFSPVQKFYDTYYTDFNERRALYEKPAGNESLKEVMQMQLWNDWNTQVHEWARAHSDGVSFDYLVMRTEDLVNPETRLAALSQLANFVGSPKTTEQLCCLSHRQLSDMGKSTVFAPRKLKEISHAGQPNIASDPMKNTHRSEHDLERQKHLSSHLEKGLPGRGNGLDEAIRRKLLDVTPNQDRNGHNITVDVQETLNQSEKNKALQDVVNQNFEGKNRTSIVHTNVQDTQPQQSDLQHSQSSTGGESTNILLEEPRGKKARDMLSKALLAKHTDETKRKALEEFIKRKNGIVARKIEKESPGEVKSRYGKWVERLEGRPELSRLLHEHGASGLRLFGYEPRKELIDSISIQMVCDESIVCAGS